MKAEGVENITKGSLIQIEGYSIRLGRRMHKTSGDVDRCTTAYKATIEAATTPEGEALLRSQPGCEFVLRLNWPPSRRNEDMIKLLRENGITGVPEIICSGDVISLEDEWHKRTMRAILMLCYTLLEKLTNLTDFRTVLLDALDSE